MTMNMKLVKNILIVIGIIVAAYLLFRVVSWIIIPLVLVGLALLVFYIVWKVKRGNPKT